MHERDSNTRLRVLRARPRFGELVEAGSARRTRYEAVGRTTSKEVNMTTTHEDSPVTASRFPSVLGPRADGTPPNGGINWDPPYPQSGSTTTSPGVPTGPDLDWRSFDGRTLDDGDQIVLTTTQTNTAYMTITLTTPHNITWWKDIEVQDWTGAVRAAAWTSDSLHSASLSVPNSELTGLSLHFKKAKFFGVHTEVYSIANLIGVDGYVMTFNWKKD
jgi:hypothetical protein